jgi:hypothetical protein
LYNYFHYKFFDNCGEEVSKLNQYTKNKIKIKLFHEKRNEKNSITSFSNNEKKNKSASLKLKYKVCEKDKNIKTKISKL